MLVLVSFALVLAATVLLVLGLLSDGGLPLIYTSIACSAAAGLVLLVAVRMSRPVVRPAAAGAGAGTEPAREPAAREPALASVGATSSTAPIPLVQVGDETDEREEAGTGASEWGADQAWNGEFPIADYDDLKVSEIMPLLPELYADELEVVEERERQGKNRATVLNRIAELKSEADDGDEAAPAADEDFPIADYDELTVGEIRDLLPELDDDELEMVRDREEDGQARASVLRDIDQLLEGEPEPPPARRTTTKTATKKAPAKKAPAKRATATKKAAPTKKAPAKKAAAKKAPATKSTAKKATTKASATRATGKKTTAKKSAAKKRGSTRR